MQLVQLQRKTRYNCLPLKNPFVGQLIFVSWQALKSFLGSFLSDIFFRLSGLNCFLCQSSDFITQFYLIQTQNLLWLYIEHTYYTSALDLFPLTFNSFLGNCNGPGFKSQPTNQLLETFLPFAVFQNIQNKTLNPQKNFICI